MGYPIRSETLQDDKLLNEIFTSSTNELLFYKNIFEIRIPKENISKCTKLHEFKILLNTINSKCSDRIIFITHKLLPKTKRILIQLEDFLKITKIFRNIKTTDFEKEITSNDYLKLEELYKFIYLNSYFDYKLIRFYKNKNNTITHNLLLLSSSNKIDPDDDLIRYLKSFDDSLDNIILSCKLKALSKI